MIARAGCTIVSMNYLAYARTLCSSFKEHNPGMPFYVLLVDELSGQDFDAQSEPYELIEVKKIGMEKFEQNAFKFNILELNTNVKPSFLKFLMRERSIERVIYLDPDILVTHSLNHVFNELDQHDIILTPHCISPITDDLRPSEQDFLEAGVFNLGFIGVKQTSGVARFLDWWEQRCLTLGFSEMRSGLFVDQKWCNLAPCLFDGVGIIKDVGWNMAYWNLHERRLGKKGNSWVVNEHYPLLFFHFSGVAVNDENQISRHQNRYDLDSRNDLAEIFAEYRRLLRSHGMDEFSKLPYQFGQFTNGEPIPQLARSLYAANAERFGDNPFDSSGEVYRWCKRRHLLGGQAAGGGAGAARYQANDWKKRTIHSGLRFLLKVLGVERYTILMRYLSDISILRNQGAIHK